MVCKPYSYRADGLASGSIQTRRWRTLPRDSWACLCNRPLLIYIGRVAHEKNIDFLIRVLPAVQRTVPSAMLVIDGEGPARESLAQLTRELHLDDSVRFVGYLDRDTSLLDCYAAADVFVFASRTETRDWSCSKRWHKARRWSPPLRWELSRFSNLTAAQWSSKNVSMNLPPRLCRY